MTKDECIEIALQNAAWEFFEIADSNHGDIKHLVGLMQAAATFEREKVMAAILECCPSDGSDAELALRRAWDRVRLLG